MCNLFVLIWSMISISFVQSDPIPTVICAYDGENLGGDPLVLEDVPDRCQVVMYGTNYFNATPPQSDTDAIKALKGAGKTVYMMYVYGNGDEEGNLKKIVQFEKTLDERIEPMLSYLKDNQIEGVFLGNLRVYANEKIPDYATKINALLGKIKSCVPSIKIGIYIVGEDAPNFTKKKLFDFTITNVNVDYYAIDLASAGVSCISDTTALGGRVPITSPNKKAVTLKTVNDATKNSGMDLSKVMIKFFVVASKIEADGSESILSYTEYCSRDPKVLWCADTIEIFHQQVGYIKNLFKGIVLAYLDDDDMDNTCGCGKFPVTNAYIDAMLGNPIKCCNAIS